MLTLLSTLFGGGSAIFTNFIKVFTEASQDRRDKAHELALYQLQLDSAKAQTAGIVEAAKAQASAIEAQSIATSIDNSIKSDNWLVALLNGLIRPVTTIMYVLAFFYFLYVVYFYAIDTRYTPLQIMSLSIFEIFFNTLNFILSFWFVNRQLGK